MLQGCSRWAEDAWDAQGLLRECSKDAQEMECSEDAQEGQKVLGMLKGCSGNAPRILRRCSGNALKMLRRVIRCLGCSGDAQGLLRGCPFLLAAVGCCSPARWDTHAQQSDSFATPTSISTSSGTNPFAPLFFMISI